MEYERPRDRLRSGLAGFAAGGLLSQDDVLSKVQENISFRIQSARELLQGGDMEESVSPMERRQKIRERRLSALREGEPGEGGPSSASSSGGSGSIGDTTAANRGGRGGPSTGGGGGTSEGQSSQSGTPSMSEANAGTKKRAQEQGFGR